MKEKEKKKKKEKKKELIREIESKINELECIKIGITDREEYHEVCDQISKLEGMIEVIKNFR